MNVHIYEIKSFPFFVNYNNKQKKKTLNPKLSLKERVKMKIP